ncbi:zinc finger protein 8 isoform X3 [Microcaecilia unicolor]|uniref:Zinc finger protein 8-like isoform X3 n=1 Tax=Microcaecilia unicolor TaxID=1415580 RepID=A0A6P7YP35_9AMPH|nr:zinc finger protein 8-like isoform X3 [Microcaecilia unicolor]
MPDQTICSPETNTSLEVSATNMFERFTAQASVTFHDVAVYFSEEDWQQLEERQKELYRSVMKEIHGALISLGYTILNSDVYFRIREENGRYFRADDLERSKGIKECTTSYPGVIPDVLLRIKEENNERYKAQHISEGWDVNNCPSAVEGYSDILLSDPFCIKQEEEIHPTQHHDIERRKLPNSCIASIPTASPDRLFTIKEEEVISFEKQHVSEGEGGIIDNPVGSLSQQPGFLGTANLLAQAFPLPALIVYSQLRKNNMHLREVEE